MKERYWKYSLIAIVLALGVILFIEFIPFFSGILGAFTLYILMRKQMLYLTEKKQIRRSIASLILLGEAVLCFLVPISLLVWLFVDKLQYLSLDTDALILSVEHIAQLIQQKTGYDVLVKDNILPAISFLPEIGQLLMDSISGFIINILVLLFVLYFMLIGGVKMEAYIYDLLPFSNKNKKNVLREINLIVRSNAIGIPLLAIIQGGIAMIGYFLFDAPNAFFLGIITCFVTIIPLIGTSLVWIPLVLYMALSGDWANAILLAVYALVIITNVDNLIRFIVQKKIADIHPLITIFGVVVGLSLFGFMGIIFGPLLISVFILCIDILKKEYLDRDSKQTTDF